MSTTERQRDRGWYGKYCVDDLLTHSRPSECFVLDLVHDPYARPTLAVYCARRGVSEGQALEESRRYSVERVDGRDVAGGDRVDSIYVVLPFQRDVAAQEALQAYAGLCESVYPLLAADIRLKVERAAGGARPD